MRGSPSCLRNRRHVAPAGVARTRRFRLHRGRGRDFMGGPGSGAVHSWVPLHGGGWGGGGMGGSIPVLGLLRGPGGVVPASALRPEKGTQGTRPGEEEGKPPPFSGGLALSAQKILETPPASRQNQ